MTLKKNNSQLFSILSTELISYCQHVQAQAQKKILTFPASEIDTFGHTLFSNLKEGGICTLVVTGRNKWEPNSHYFQSARFAAQKGRNITRLFLLPHRQCKHDRCFLDHKRLDDESGIKTRAYFVGDLISSLTLPYAESLDFGIWDDEVCCTGIYGRGSNNSGLIEWRVSRREEDIQLLKDILSILSENAEELSFDQEQDQDLDLEEPMITTAPIVYELAPVLCQGDHVSPNDCSWYHSIWQYLRIFNMVSTPTWHSEFYLNSFLELSKKENFNNILISGTADYSLLAHVLWAYRSLPHPPNISVVDLCETPLFLCKWYAKSVGCIVNTHATDIFTFDQDKPFDLITSDAFITRFSPENRKNVLQKWKNLLRTGGKIITTVRIETISDGDHVGSSAQEADLFRNKAKQEARKWKGFLGHAIEDIVNSAQRYAERMVSYSVTSTNEAEKLFTNSGFTIEKIDIIKVPGEMKGTTYAEIIAVSE